MLRERLSGCWRFLFPDMPDRSLPSPRALAAAREVEQPYTRAARDRVEWAQCHAGGPPAPAQLSFYPIAKNLRGLGTTICRNVACRRRTILVPGNDHEAALLGASGRPPWSPWLWSRIPRGQLHNVPRAVDDPDLAWPTYFLPLGRPTPGLGVMPPAPPAPGPGARTRAILRMAAATCFVFRLNRETQRTVDAWRTRMGWEDDRPTLGIHLRRGDAASEDLGRQTRRSYRLEEYLTSADVLCGRYGIRTLYLSTESELEIERARRLRPGYRIRWLPHDRSVFPRITETSRFIEDAALADPSIIEPVVLSALADLWFLQRCQAFVGTFNSEFSLLAWLLCIGWQGHIVPYINLARRRDRAFHQARLEFALR